MEYFNIVFQEIYKILFLLVPVLVSVAMIVWLDRRVWAFVQKRQGPNVVGPFGLLQSLADALKYIFKEIIIPSTSNKVIFILAPIVTMTLALISWAVIPFSATLGFSRYKCWNFIFVCCFFFRSLWNYYGWLGLKFKISISWSYKICGSNGFL
jgi:NADH:ubiquinone oxidoreductase subunit H